MEASHLLNPRNLVFQIDFGAYRRHQAANC